MWISNIVFGILLFWVISANDEEIMDFFDDGSPTPVMGAKLLLSIFVVVVIWHLYHRLFVFLIG
jgi:hypothetical protein